jgi:hypothetical protein
MFNIPTVTVAKNPTIGSGETASSVTLTYVAPSVAWTPRHLLVRTHTIGTTGNPNILTRFNGDDGSNYNVQAMDAFGTTKGGARITGATSMAISGNIGATANIFTSGEILLPDALSTRSYKSALNMSGRAEEYLRAGGAGRWADTAAITSVTLFTDSSTFAAGSTFELCVVDESFNIDEQIKTAGTGAGTFTVSSIGGSNGDIVQIGSLRGARDAASDNYLIEFNGDTTTTNYQRQVLQGIDSTVNSGSSNANNPMHAAADGAGDNIFGATLLHIPNYSDGANDRALNTLNGFHASASSSRAMVSTARWNNTAAITAIKMLGETTANFVVGSMLSTYAVPKNLIARQENTGSAGITFSDIPQTYDHLEVSCYVRDARTAGSDSLLITLNDDTTVANYDRQALYGSGSGVTANQSAADNTIGNIPDANHTANAFGATTVTIYNYTKTDRHKHILSVSGEDAFNYAGIHSLRWENTAAVTKLLINGGNGDLVSGSVIELRGISADTTAAAPSDVAALNGIASADIAAVN